MTTTRQDGHGRTRTSAIDDRYEKGSAMSVIESERVQIVEKTNRLKAMRLAQEAAAEAEVKIAPVKKAPRKRKV